MIKSKYAKSKISKNQYPTIEELEKAFYILAYFSLKENGENVSDYNIDIESSRITRCVEHYYKIQEHDLPYPEFACKFIMRYHNEIIYGDKFLDDFISDIPDPLFESVYEPVEYNLSYLL